MRYTLDDHLHTLAVATARVMAGTETAADRRLMARHCIVRRSDAYGFLIAIQLWQDYNAHLRSKITPP